MTVLKELTFKFKAGDNDTTGRPLQVKETVHRAALMPVLRGKYPSGQSQFKDPTGIATYYGFGADGWYYEAGVKGRTWTPRQCIDDFSDLVTDIERWDPIVRDLLEGGLDPADLPFGKRLYAEYAGPAAEISDRKGKMTTLAAAGGQAVLSGRVTTIANQGGAAIDNSVLLGAQQVGSDNDWLFVGFVNTSAYPFSIVQGQVVAGIPTVTSALSLPPGTFEVEVAIEVDYAGAQYRGYYSLVPTAEPYTGGSWFPVGPAQVFPAGWPSDAVPRIHAEFPAAYTFGLRHSLSDVRVEGGTWEGQERATWWLETQDLSLPLSVAGLRPECPDEVIVYWGRDDDEICDLVLVDTDDPSDPKLWRRWPNIGVWKNTDFGFDKYWSPGWLDADEGHVVLTRNTKGNLASVSGDEKGEIWLFSLRWDKVIVFDVDEVGAFVSYYNSGTGRILREGSTWGSRRWNGSATYEKVAYYDTFQIPITTPFVGTLRNINFETVVPAITYGANIRRTNDDKIYLLYGIQEVPTTLGTTGEYFAGVIELDEDNSNIKYERGLFRKDDSAYNVWDESDDAWVVVGLNYERALWWLQAGEFAQFDELEGVLCRKDTSATPFGNISTAPYNEDNFWLGTDLFIGKGINLNVLDSDPSGDEVVFVASGWKGGSHLSVLWYDSGTPASSVVKTYGIPNNVEGVSHGLDKFLPFSEYPRWASLQYPNPLSSLDRCRVSGGAGVGAQSFVSVNDGVWLGYVQFEGVASKTFTHGHFRGAPIDRGDFVLELTGRYIPPFAAGYKFQAADFMTLSQSASFMLGVLGDKRVEGTVALTVKGSSFGGPRIEAAFRNATVTGDLTNSGVLFPPNVFLQPGGLLKMRIKRTGGTWFFLFYNEEQAIWQQVLRVETGLRVPLIPFIRTSYIDNVGIACSTAVELDNFTLAPAGDALGVPFYRPVQNPTIQSLFGQAAGGAGFREAIPASDAGSFVFSDAWIFPGIMPRP